MHLISATPSPCLLASAEMLKARQNEGQGERRRIAAFTLIELMVVVAIMGLILATGIPSLVKMARREGMRLAVYDVMEVCKNARARAIFGSSVVEVVFHPTEKRFEVSGGGPARSGGEDGESRPAPATGEGMSGVIPEGVEIEMLDVNLLEYSGSDFVRVRFFPNGTSDELTLILRSDKNEWKKITLEVTTGLATVVDFTR